MSRMIFDLTEQDRGALERVRAGRGYRSGAEALRALIVFADECPDEGPSAPAKADLSGLHPRLPSAYAVAAQEPAKVSKTEPPRTSRLKGQWKAP